MESRTRSLLIQTVFVAAILSVLALLATTAHRNLVAQHIASGFGFLSAQTGWDVASSLVPHTSSDSYAWTFFVGFLNTLLVASICIVLATLFGLGLGFLAVSSNPLVRAGALLYVNLFRNVPQILQLFFWYNVTRQLPPVRQAVSIGGVAFLSNRGLNLPSIHIDGAEGWLVPLAVGALAVVFYAYRPWRGRVPVRPFTALSIGLIAFLLALAILKLFDLPAPGLSVEPPRLAGFNFRGGSLLGPEFVALVTALVFYNVAFIAEIIRNGVMSVPSGQFEAAASLGLRSTAIFRKVVLPQALRVAVPPLTSQYISLAKSTSLAVAIGFTELFQVATITINNTGQSIENIAILMVVYLTLSGVLSGIGRATSSAFRWPALR